MNNENNVMKAVEEALAGNQLRKFDFASYEISDDDKAKIEEQEVKILNSFRKYKNNLFDICSSLAEVAKLLKPSGSFMAWYESAGLTKDMVSVFLKRWDLYLWQPDYRDKIFSLSDQAIKIISNNSLGLDVVKGILESDVLKVREIKKLLPQPKKEEKEEKVEVIVEGQKYFNFNKIKKMEKRAKKLKDEEKAEYKKELTEYINSLQKLMEEL